MIKCVAIDDEPIALSIIREYCNRYGNIDLQCFTSPVAGMECVMSSRPDIVFLDIEMNSHNGIELAKQLPPDTCLIFTTAFSNYAIDGFNVDAVDFLQKPIFYPRFERAMEKARKFMALPDNDAVTGTIALKSEHKNVIINFKDIVVIEAMDNYVKIFRRDLPTIVSQITMKEVEGMLPASGFMRVHRSFIVALGRVESFGRSSIILRDSGTQVPIGDTYRTQFMQRMG